MSRVELVLDRVVGEAVGVEVDGSEETVISEDGEGARQVA